MAEGKTVEERRDERDADIDRVVGRAYANPDLLYLSTMLRLTRDERDGLLARTAAPGPGATLLRERVEQLEFALTCIANTSWPPGYAITAAHGMIRTAREALAAADGAVEAEQG